MTFDPISYILAKKYWKIKLETEGAINVLYDTDKDNLVDQLASHSHVRADITDLLPITRTDLEYPTENVKLIYLLAIGKADFVEHWNSSNRFCLFTVDSFTDKAIEGIQIDDNSIPVSGRRSAIDTEYIIFIVTSGATNDFRMDKMVAGTQSSLTYEAVDLASPVHFEMLSITGSTLKGFRDKSATPQLTATDTDIASGLWGAGEHTTTWKSNATVGYLKPPASPSPKPLRILEVDITGSGKENDPYRPNLLQDLREISQLTGLPDFLYREAKRYEILKAKGFTDEEIELLFGSIPQHQVDLASVTFGSFEFRHDSPTNIIAVYSDNPYQSGAILKQEEAVKAKNLKVLKPPRDYLEAKQQYSELRKEFTEWLAGKDNYAYQMLGHEDFEAMQASDMYYGELIEHKTHYKQIKQVPDWEIRRNLQRWKDRLKRGKILAEEREKHLRKLEEIERLGW